ncbi:MAG TPA: hypothetical protein VFD94_05695 [Jatrophihabitans sp.]|nr:hypothetical protein [Jatrophihabitans sp.]
MATGRAPTPQQRDAHELARTPQANPYRGAMLDPFATTPNPSATTPKPSATTPNPLAGASDPSRRPARTHDPSAATEPVPVIPPWTGTATPAAATAAGVLGLALSVAMALFGVSLLALLSLQSDFGAPDRSFYRGADSGSVVLALVDFGLAAGCATGSIMLMGGRVIGRIACTVSGWLILCLSAFWYLLEHDVVAPVIVALAAGAMLLFSYQGSVTRWLGVLPAPQPD